jgi:hypothetical protein
MKSLLHGARKPLLVSLTCGLFVWLYLLTFGNLFVSRDAAADSPAPLPSPFELSHPAVGEVAPEFTLRDVDGKPFRLRDESGKVPVVIEFGSFT